MNVKTVSVCYGRKVNLGDFNSAHVECTIWADVDEEEQPELNRIMQDLWVMAKENVKGQVRPLAAAHGMFPDVEMKEYFMGLPVRKAEKT